MPYIPILCDQRLTKNKETLSNLAIMHLVEHNVSATMKGM